MRQGPDLRVEATNPLVRWLGVLTLVSSSAMPSCLGHIGDDENGSHGVQPGGSGQTGPVDVAFAGMRRMTPEQYENTMRDLFGDPDLELDLDPDAGSAVTLLAVDKLNRAAEAIVARRDLWTAPVFPCDTLGADDETCVDGFIRSFGRRAFRRTLGEDEVSDFKGAYNSARAEQSFDEALVVVLEIMIQSPEVYYFVELGSDAGGSAGPRPLASGVRPLTGWERATRLSYFVWNTTPDDALLDAAESGALDGIAGVRTQAERLLSNDRARHTMVQFFSEMLEIDGGSKHAALEVVPKSAEVFPEDSPELRAAMRAELEAVVERTLFDGDGRYETLLTTTDAYVNGPLAKLYGVDGPADPATFAWVSLPADQRAGIFTRAAFLTVFSSVEVKSPIRRGAYILKKALCTELGPPPPNAMDVPVMGGAIEEGGQVVHKTIRQDVETKTSGGVCLGCHQMINPIGFTFEHYDALGRWQTKEAGVDEDGKPYSLDIDASGSIPGDEAAGVLDGGIELSAALAASAPVRDCLVRHLFEAALRRVPIDRDLGSVDAATSATESGGTVRDLVVALATSDAFLHMRTAEE